MWYAKLTSGQFLVTVATAFTYCVIVGYTTIFYLSKATPDKVEGFAMGLVMGFASMAGTIYKSYFDRDRSKTDVAVEPKKEVV
jgi:hypothetical protein